MIVTLTRVERVALRAFAYENLLAVVKNLHWYHRILSLKLWCVNITAIPVKKDNPVLQWLFIFCCSNSQRSTKHFLAQGHYWEQRAATYKKIMVPKAQHRKSMGYLQYTGWHTQIVLCIALSEKITVNICCEFKRIKNHLWTNSWTTRENWSD